MAEKNDPRADTRAKKQAAIIKETKCQTWAIGTV